MLRRLVSLTCSNTEIVCALGCGDRLVGVDDFSDHPREQLAGLPRVGPDLDIDIDAVAALEPDLVLASLTVPGHERVVAAVEDAGLPHIAPAPESLSDIAGDIRRIAELLGVPERGAALIAAFEEGLRPVEPTTGSRPSVAVQWWPKPAILAGRRSWAAELVERAGGRNVLQEPCASRPCTDDEIANWSPSAFVLSWCGIADEKIRPEVVTGNLAWRTVSAIERDRVFVIPEAYLGRPGPRLVEGFRRLRQIVETCGG